MEQDKYKYTVLLEKFKMHLHAPMPVPAPVTAPAHGPACLRLYQNPMCNYQSFMIKMRKNINLNSDTDNFHY
jgi:hypothetical protein